MNIAFTYFFPKGLNEFLLRRLLLASICFLSLSPVFAQQYSLRDQAEIKYQAQLTLIEYESILNLMANAAISEAVAAEAAQSAYQDPATKIFYSPEVPVVNNLAPSRLGTNQPPIAIQEYMQTFNEQYVKSELETVNFYDFKLSNLRKGEQLYLLANFKVHFKGRHQQDAAPYKPIIQTATLRAERKDNRWVTYITGITQYNAVKPFGNEAEEVVLNATPVDDGTFTDKLEELNQSQLQQLQHVNDAFIAESWKAFDAKRFEDLRRKGQQAAEARAYKKAGDFYRQALLIKPEESSLKASLAQIDKSLKLQEDLAKMVQEGDYVEAIQAYSKAIAENPGLAEYYYGRGKSYVQLNELETALKDFTRAIELDPAFAEALQARAKLYERTAQPAKALADYTQIIQRLPEASAAYYPERAKLRVAMNDLKGAVADYDAAIKLKPAAATPYYEKGQLLLQLKQPEEAIRAFSAAVGRDTAFAAAYYARGKAYAETENISSAAVDFALAQKLGVSPEQQAAIDGVASDVVAIGEEAMRKGDYKGALESFIKLVLLAPANEKAWVRKGDAHYLLKDNANALQSYSKAIALQKPSLAYYNRGLVYRDMKKAEAAKSDFEKFVPIGWQLISQAESKAATAKSTEELEQIAGEVASGWYRLGNAQYLAAQYSDALASLDKALDINKSYADALFVRGAVQLELKNYKKAIKDIEKSIKWGIKDTPWIYLALGDAYQALGETEYAISVYTYIIDSVDKNFDLSYLHRANSYKSLRQYQLALQDIQTAMSVNEALKQDVAWITNKGLLELYESRFQEAEQSFDRALKLEANDAWALYGKASVLASQNRLEESLDLYRKAFQTGKIEWSAIKDDPIIKHVSKQKAFKDLVDASLRL